MVYVFASISNDKFKPLIITLSSRNKKETSVWQYQNCFYGSAALAEVHGLISIVYMSLIAELKTKHCPTLSLFMSHEM